MSTEYVETRDSAGEGRGEKVGCLGGLARQVHIICFSPTRGASMELLGNRNKDSSTIIHVCVQRHNHGGCV